MRILGKKSIIACCATALLSGVLPLSAPVSAVIIGGYVAPFRNVDKQSVSDLAINQSTGEVFAVGRTFTATTATNPISNVPSRNAAGFLSKIDVNGRIVWSKQNRQKSAIGIRSNGCSGLPRKHLCDNRGAK